MITGRVASVREFGAFVELGGGVQGLLHVSEMGWSRVTDASQVVKPGDEITVKVLRVDDDKQKISLGLKQLRPIRGRAAGETLSVGQVRKGRVTRVAEFGAFVELEPGVEGLVPLSESGVARDTDLKKSFPVGTDIEVVVLELDAAARRIRLSVKAVEEAKEGEEVREYQERKDAKAPEGFGSLASKLRGALTPEKWTERRSGRIRTVRCRSAGSEARRNTGSDHPNAIASARTRNVTPKPAPIVGAAAGPRRSTRRTRTRPAPMP